MSTEHVLNHPSTVGPDTARAPAARTSKTGWALTVLPCLPLLGGVPQMLLGALPPEAVQGMKDHGIDLALARPIGLIELAVVVLCLVPRTAFVGAILFAGWAGGAIMTHLRVGEPVYLPAAIAIAVWVGLGLRRPAEFASLLGVKRAV